MNRRDYRKNDIDAVLRKARFYPLDIMVTGVTGAGKSTTLNSLFGKEVASVGRGCEPETISLDAYEVNDFLRIWDTPGLGDGKAADERHSRAIIDLLYKEYYMDNCQYGFIDMVIVIIEGSNRDMGTTYHLLNDVIVPNFPKERILVAINQADAAMKGRHWIGDRPDGILKAYLDEQASSIQKRIMEATGVNIIKPIYYSAETGYNIERFMDFFIDNMPTERRSFREAC